MKRLIWLVCLAWCGLSGLAATVTVTVPSTTTLTNTYVPYATSGSQLGGNSPLRRISSTAIAVDGNLVWNGSTNSVFDSYGSGSPEGVVTASPGSLYRDAANGDIYKKETGTGNTGWVELTGGGGGGGSSTNALIGFQILGSGTDFSYSIGTAEYEKIAFGTSGPSFVLTNVGSYQIIANVAAFDNGTAYQDFYMTNVTDHVVVPGSVHSVLPSSSSIDNVLPMIWQLTTTGANRTIELWGQTHNATYTTAGVKSTNTVIDVIQISEGTGGITMINGVSGAFTTGAGVTNVSTVLSGNYTAGSGVTLTTNAYGAVAISSSGGGGATINPTDLYLPYRSNSTTFADSPVAKSSNTNLLVEILQTGTNTAAFTPYGGLLMGRHTVSDYNASISSTVGFAAESFDTFDGLTYGALYLQRGNANLDWLSYVDARAAGTTNSDAGATLLLGANFSDEILFNASGGTVAMQMSPASVQRTLLAPLGAPTPYIFDTATAHSSGDLVEVANNGTNKFVVLSDGTVTVQGRTNRLGDDGTRLTYNGSPLVTFVYPVACSDETTAITAGTGKVTFRMPFACTLTSVRASLTTAQASGSIFTVDINEAGTSVLSTKLTIDNTEKTSTTAATPAVISDSAIADDAEMSVDVDQIGNGSATGLKVEIYGYQ